MATYYYSGYGCTNTGLTYNVTSEFLYSLPQIVSTEKFDCVTLTGVLDLSGAYENVVSIFTTCQDCLSTVKCNVIFVDCDSGESFEVGLNSVLQLPFVPQIGDIYLITLKVYRDNTYIQLCCFVSQYTNKDVRCAVRWELISISPSSFGLKDGVGCEDCVDSAPSYWRVRECISGNNYIVSLPAGPTYKNYGITFTIDTLGVDLYCGIIIERIQYSPPRCIKH